MRTTRRSFLAKAKWGFTYTQNYEVFPFYSSLHTFKFLNLNKLICVYSLGLLCKMQDLFSLTIPLVKQKKNETEIYVPT